MDILASMLAYLVCVAGIVTGLAMSFLVFFSVPSQLTAQLTAPPAAAIAMVAAQRSAAGPSALKTVVKVKRAEQQIVAAAAQAQAAPPLTIAIDARQKPPVSQAHLRRLSEQQRAKHLAYRERSSFETRFLHYDD